MQSVSQRVILRRILPALAAAAMTAWGVAEFLAEPRPRYLTLNPSVSQRFVAVPSEAALADLCYRLDDVQGVTGVSYRDYSAATKSALVTVFFDPRETSVRQLKIFMLHTKILWQMDMRA